MKNLVIALALLAVFAAVQSMPAGKYRFQLFDRNCSDFCISNIRIFSCHSIETLFIVCTPFSNTRVSLKELRWLVLGEVTPSIFFPFAGQAPHQHSILGKMGFCENFCRKFGSGGAKFFLFLFVQYRRLD